MSSTIRKNKQRNFYWRGTWQSYTRYGYNQYVDEGTKPDITNPEETISNNYKVEGPVNFNNLLMNEILPNFNEQFHKYFNEKTKKTLVCRVTIDCPLQHGSQLGSFNVDTLKDRGFLLLESDAKLKLRRPKKHMFVNRNAPWRLTGYLYTIISPYQADGVICIEHQYSD